MVDPDVISPDRHTNWQSNICEISVVLLPYHAVISAPFSVGPEEFPAMSKIGQGPRIATPKWTSVLAVGRKKK